MNTASIQSEKIKKKIEQLNKKLYKVYNLQYKLSETQKQLFLAKQNTLEIK